MLIDRAQLFGHVTGAVIPVDGGLSTTVGMQI
jgi:hypothetical protein